MIQAVLASLVLFAAAAAHAGDDCGIGTLSDKSRVDNLKAVLECLDRKIDGRRADAPAPPKTARPAGSPGGGPACIAEDDGHPLIRGCVLSVALNQGRFVAVQIILENKSGSALWVTTDNAVHACGAALSDNAGNGNSVYGCTLSQHARTRFSTPEGVKTIITQGTAISPGNRLTRTFAFQRHASADATQVSLDLELLLVEDSEAGRKASKPVNATLSFPGLPLSR